MTWYYGATHDLENLIKTHLFIICPNNSGSTYLKTVLATSQNTWNLMNEGQHTAGFAGPSSRNQNAGKLWATEELIDLFKPEAYNWELIRKSWYFQAYSLNPEATVFVEKSPTFLLNVNQLVRHFEYPKFIFMVRNPYATVEGIRRRWRQKKPIDAIPDEKNLLTRAAGHVMTCFEYQRRNIQAYSKQSVFFTYEEMCDQFEQTENLIKSLVPELSDFKLKQQMRVKNYNESLRNMNAQQLANLKGEEICWINQVFEKHMDLLVYFGYFLID